MRGSGTQDTEALDSNDIQPPVCLLQLPAHWEPRPPHAPTNIAPNSQLLRTSPHLVPLHCPPSPKGSHPGNWH